MKCPIDSVDRRLTMHPAPKPSLEDRIADAAIEAERATGEREETVAEARASSRSGCCGWVPARRSSASVS